MFREIAIEERKYCIMPKARNKLQDMYEELEKLIQKREALDQKIMEQEEKIKQTKTEEIMDVVSAVNVSPSELKAILEAHFQSLSSVSNERQESLEGENVGEKN